MLLAQASDFGGERRVIGIEVKAPPLGDFSRVRGSAGPIKQLAVERGRRDEFCRRLAGIKRGAARIAIDVDDRAREPRPHHSRAEWRDKIVKRVQPPIRVFAREPWINEGRFESEELCPRVGNADDERRIAALDDEPIGTLGGHRAGLSSRGQRRGANRINDGAAAHEAGRRGDVRMKVPVVFEAGNVAAQQRPQSFERRARCEGRVKIAGLGGGEQFNADDRHGVIGHRRQAPCAMRGHRDVILLVGRGRNGIDAGRMGEGLVLGDQRGCGHLRDHKPGIEPGLRGQKRRQTGQSRIDQERDPALRERADFANRERDHIRGEGDRLGVKVAA